ncbi:MAG: 4-hydroxythreonine-4-phosphate dehydrogenase PdxA, partial [Planctomycetota bacterium]|nr:4-hydroxythreonine-4-phosphate dehydrogenase PdxA [Planctomycetota bacterium]
MQNSAANSDVVSRLARLPVIALTVGDAAGIGPEVLVRTAASEELRAICRPVAVGHPKIFARAAQLTGVSLDVVPVSGFDALQTSDALWSSNSDHSVLPCIVACDDDVADVPFGSIDKRAGQAAYDCLVAATKAALAGHINAITTAPLNKAALRAAGLDYPGHTEILGDVCGVN